MRKEGRVVRSPRAAGSKAAKWMIRERNWLSELNKFWITEPNRRKFNKMSWLFLKFIIPVGSGHCDYSSWVPEDLVKPLILLVCLLRAFHCNSRENIKFHRQAQTARIYVAHFLPLVYYKVAYSYKLFYFTDQKFVRFIVDKKNQLDVTFYILYLSSNSCSTWLPETCWATIRREIKNTKSGI